MRHFSNRPWAFPAKREQQQWRNHLHLNKTSAKHRTLVRDVSNPVRNPSFVFVDFLF